MPADKNVVLDLTNYKDRRGGRVEPGEYPVVVEDVESAQSAKGNPYLTIWLRVTEGPEQGETLIDRLVLTEKSLWRVVAFLQAVGVPTPRKRLSIPYRTIIGRKLVVEVEDGDPYNGTVRSEVRGYIKIKGANVATTDDLPSDEPKDEPAPAAAVEVPEPETVEVPAAADTPDMPETLNLDDIEL